MNRLLFCMLFLFFSADIMAASDITVAAGSRKVILQNAMARFIAQKAQGKEPGFDAYIKDGSVIIPQDADSYIIKNTDQFGFDVEKSNITLTAQCRIAGGQYDISFDWPFLPRQAVIILDERNDMTGCVKNRNLRDIIIEEHTGFHSKYFFESAQVRRDGDALKITFVPKKNLPGFIARYNTISEIKTSRDIVLIGELKPKLSNAESGFDKTMIDLGFTAGSDSSVKPMYKLLVSSVNFNSYPVLETTLIAGKVTGKAVVLKSTKTIDRDALDINSKGQVNIDLLKNEALSSFGHEAALYFVRCIVRESFYLDASASALTAVKRGFLAVSENDLNVPKTFFVQYKLKPENGSKNPYLKEFEAAFCSVFSGTSDKNASYNVIIELSPVYDQKVPAALVQSGRGLKSKRNYCIITIFKGKNKVYSENVTEAGMGLADDVAAKNATINTAKRAAALVKEYYEK